MPSSPSIPMPMTPVYPSLHSSCPCRARWRRIGAPALRRPLVVCLVLGSLMLLPPAWAGFDEGMAAYLGGARTKRAQFQIGFYYPTARGGVRRRSSVIGGGK